MFGFLRKKPVEYFLDTEIHSHLLPGLDDGVQSWEESLGIIKELYELGVKRLVTTPHIMSDYYPNSADKIMELATILQTKLMEEKLPVKLSAAAEYYMDEQLLNMINNERLLTFGDNYILVLSLIHI